MLRIVTIFTMFLMALWMALPGCARVTPVVVDCSRLVSAELLPAVESALVADNYVDELARMVAQFGECVIRTGVQQITGEAKQDMQFAQTDLNARRKYDHGMIWLSAHPGP